MKSIHFVEQKIYSFNELIKQVTRWKFMGKRIVFTNGCFDILHKGHLASLMQAASFGDVLVVGLNADKSVKKLKGEGRPVNDENTRALTLASLVVVDAVCIFNEETPLNMINKILPDVLVKGGDYALNQVAGAKEVIANGGEVKLLPLLPGYSTTSLINKMRTSG